MQEPSTDAYGRVTNPERFAALIPVVDELLDRLSREYPVSRDEGLDLDADLTASVGGVVRVVRLAPTQGDGAPIVVAVTTFPGVRVRYGNWHIEGYPVCGCDACDEQPDELAADLTERVVALVEGRFGERLSVLRRPGISYTFGDGAGWSRLPRRHVVKLGGPKTVTWAPWLAIG